MLCGHQQHLALMDAVVGQQLELLGHSPTEAVPPNPSAQIQLLVDLASGKAELEHEKIMQLQSHLQASQAKYEKLQQSRALGVAEAEDIIRTTKSQLSTVTTELSQMKNENTLLKNQLQQL